MRSKGSTTSIVNQTYCKFTALYYFSAENLLFFLSFCIKTFRCGVAPCNLEVKIWYLAEYKYVKKKKKVCDSVDFTSKYYEFSREKHLATMTKICKKPALYVKPIVLDFWTVPEHMWQSFLYLISKGRNWRVNQFPKVKKSTSGK